jgi:hypothetical protein
MLRLAASTFLLLTMLFLANIGFAGTDKESSTTTWVDEQGIEVRGNWTAGEIIEVETVEDYYWHNDHYDPSANYQVAPWLYDPFNLSRESGGDEGKN